jgi:hypothetical protein
MGIGVSPDADPARAAARRVQAGVGYECRSGLTPGRRRKT